MSDLPGSYGRALYERNIPPEELEQARYLLTHVPELQQALENPLIRKGEKHRVIQRLFPQSTWSFVKVLSDNGATGLAAESFAVCDRLRDRDEGTLEAVYTCVTRPDETRLQRLRETLCAKYHKKQVKLTLVEEPSLLGGFVLTIGGTVLDRSLRTALTDLKHRFAGR